ncbi:hypothetical protein CHUAL_013289 [Chamberlinius hualienensis]
MPAKQSQSALLALQDKVARIYYTHGVFCSSHPIPVISLAVIIIILCCYPFIYLPLPGNDPQEHVTPWRSYVPPSLDEFNSSASGDSLSVGEVFQPRWLHGLPVGYVQQILVHSSVSGDVNLVEAYRAPLSKVFDILEITQNYQLLNENGSLTLDDVCMHISESVAKKIKDHLPSYGCLIVSPANIWKQNMQLLRDDPEIVRSVVSLGQKPADPSSSLSVILFGIPWSEIAVKSANPKNRPKLMSFALTIIMKEYNPLFMQGLEERLRRSFPLIQNQSITNGNITHIYFCGQYGVVEFVPLIVAYVILFLYIYFSVRKIEMVKSKIGMAFSAVVTVVASLCMSVGLCTWFGLSFTIKAGRFYLKDVFPYLVVIIGLENILVLTKSVVSTPVNLDVKVRLAQGLSKEGWSITKNLVTELSILTFGFFTFVPAIQEFCLFAVVGLLSDFFLQMVFFATVLGVDIGRMEMSDLQRQLSHQNMRQNVEDLHHMYPVFQWPLLSRYHRNEFKNKPIHSASPTESSKESKFNFPISETLKLPKRLRLVYFWARCRIFQRMFMVAFVVWVAFIVYKAGLVSLFTVEETATPSTEQTIIATTESFIQSLPLTDNLSETAYISSGIDTNASKLAPILKYKNQELWRLLLRDHWPTLFGYFNISLVGRYISILPTIKLAIQIESDGTSRNQQLNGVASTQSVESLIETFYLDEALNKPGHSNWHSSSQAYYPSSPTEIALTVILAIPSIVFLLYVMVVLYQCICSKNYAEWRSSWSQSGSKSARDMIAQMVVEAMPIVLDGHPQEIECVATHENLVVSSCLAGEIRVWDSTSGECLTVIDCKRRIHQPTFRVNKDDVENVDESNWDPELLLSTSGHSNDINSWKQRSLSLASPTEPKERFQTTNRNPLPYNYSSDDLFVGNRMAADCSKSKKDLFKFQPNLSSTIDTNFTATHQRSKSATLKVEDDGYDFSHFQIHYDEHRQLMNDEDEIGNIQFNKRSRSGDLSPSVAHSPSLNQFVASKSEDMKEVFDASSPIWCIDCKDNLIVVGCGDGRIEMYHSKTGVLRYLHESDLGQGIVSIRIYNNTIVAARLNGSIEFLEMSVQQPNSPFCQPTMHRRIDGITEPLSHSGSYYFGDGDIVCQWSHQVKAHQQPITVLAVEGGKAVTGSQDHSLKVFRVDGAMCLYTLHGHYGPITSLFIDKLSPMTVASGSHTGEVYLWDVMTGLCERRLQGHDGAVVALSYTASYVLSVGADNRLVVWERFQGHILNNIYLNQSYCRSIIMLTDNLLLTGQQGSLGVWDIRTGTAIRSVRLGDVDERVLVRHIHNVEHTIVCDYGNQLRVVQFPAIFEKNE